MIKSFKQRFLSLELQSPRWSSAEITVQDYELRHYETAKWASTVIKGKMQKEALRQGFWKLFYYIQGKNEKEMKIEMTVPVTCLVKSGCTDFKVSFFVPFEHQDSPPQPTDPDVFIEERKREAIFVRSFGGFASPEKYAEEAQALARILKSAEVEAEPSQTRTKHQERPPESHRVTPNLNRSLSPRHNTPKGSRLGQVSTVLDIRELSPPEESTSPQIIEQSSDVESREPILRINRAGQWYVETGVADRGGRNDDDVRVLGGVRIKTENLEEWLGTENQPSGEDGSSAEEVTTMVIDTTGHGSMGQETYTLGSSGAKVVRPTSSEIDRIAELSVLWRVLNIPLKQLSFGHFEKENMGLDEPVFFPDVTVSLVEESAMIGVSGYVEYLREQEVSERWFRYNPRLTCIYCAKSFNQKGSLDRHMRLHMGITPFVCRMCGKKYTRKDQLEYHIRKHTGNKPFHCHVCGKSFPFQAILNQHFRKNHPGCVPLEGPHSISPETTVTSRGQAEEESPPQEEAVVAGETAQGSVSTTGPD
ncbi:Zinc finger and BTB domain-containing protein 37 [Chelonia mydas]|uniref:Zinc finger and BTB domain-containing protein 37 n=1 Tax=Chelonia mydas TaxID=8469 RepID=M7BQZ3_CHEMY|nr:Zinc finger and BTB domain-containing protein 37 [Chelonia mydas]